MEVKKYGELLKLMDTVRQYPDDLGHAFALRSYIAQYWAHSTPESKGYLEMAIETLHREGELEIDEVEPIVSISPDGDGAYVKAWIWVDAPEPEEEEDQ